MEGDQMKEKRNLLEEKMDVRWRTEDYPKEDRGCMKRRMDDVSEGGWRRRWM